MTNRLPSFRAALILSGSAAVLSACASKPVPPPQISYDAADFKSAAIEKARQMPVKVVEVPKPLPLPGQLQPEPGKVAKDRRSPEERVADANKAATQQPTKFGYVNAVQVYPFADGALYQLYAAPERVTDIALQPGEKLTSVSAGDTVRWVIGDTTSGSGDDQRTHVLVKPFAPGLATNLVITTDRRSYHLQLQSTEKTAMAAISWTYSEDQIIALRRRNAEAEAAAPAASNVALENIHFRYSITGDTPAWRPTRAFDDGSKVYIEFPGRIDQGEAPPLFIVGADGDNQLVNYRMRGNYYIVDRLFAAAELRLGTKQQQVVRITRTDGRQPPRRVSLFSRFGR
ncbi:P-type conjugative transfer protein TrbG [Mesorhizobium sp. M0292]|uniref:P-type conjugative transfer protein TrbG n=1 Tax=Mesorhizobium sp. M0292 TaxID=2956929 RepID=UPI003335E88B